MEPVGGQFSGVQPITLIMLQKRKKKKRSSFETPGTATLSSDTGILPLTQRGFTQDRNKKGFN